MDVTSNTNTASNMLSGVIGTKNDGTSVTGNIATKTSSDLTASGATVTAPAGYYANAASKSVTTTTHPNPSASITSSTGVVTASHTQTTGYVTSGTTTSTMQLTSQAAATYNTSTADQTISSYRWLTGTQTIKSVTTSNLIAANIASGVTVKVGDANNASRITQVTGTYAPAVSSLTVTPTETAQTFNATGVYGYKPVTINAISSTYVGTNIARKSSADITFASATGTFTAPIGYYSTAATKTVTTQAAQTIYPSTADQTIASYRWLTGTQTIKSVTTSNLSASNIASGVTVKVGDTNNASRITQITGTYAPTVSALTVTPMSTQQIFNAIGVYGYKPVTVNGDANLVASNIASGVSIFGVTGTYGGFAGPTFTFRFDEDYNVSSVTCDKTFSECKNIADSGDCQALVTCIYYDSPTEPMAANMFALSASYVKYLIPCDPIIDYPYRAEIIYKSNSTIEYNFYPILLTNLSVTSNGTYSSSNTWYRQVDVDVDSGGYTCTLTNSGSGTDVCVIYNNTNYRVSGSSFTFNAGDTLTVYCAYGSDNFVRVNGTIVAGGSRQGVRGYSYTLPACSISVSFTVGLGASYVDITIPTINIIENGSYDVCNYGIADVNVSGGGGGSGAEDGIIQRTISGAYENSRVSTIGGYAFASANSLTTVSFPNVISIYTQAFRSCVGLISANFSNATHINDYAFYYCTHLTSISFPKALSIGASAFLSCWGLTEVNFPSASYIGGCAFQYCSSLTTISFPNASYIGYSAFVSCWNLTEINFPSVTSMGGYVFQYCTSLTMISLPICTAIPSGTFSSCTGLISVDLPEVSRLYSSAFLRCTNLTTVSFSKLTRIDASAFASCYNLLSVYLLGSSKVTLMNITAFASTPISTYTTSTGGVYGSIFVPSSLYSTYTTDTIWSYYIDRLVSV